MVNSFQFCYFLFDFEFVWDASINDERQKSATGKV